MKLNYTTGYTKADWQSRPEEPEYPSPISHGNLSYDGVRDRFYIQGHRMSSQSHLQSTFFPDIDSERAEANRASMDKGYMTAQFEHFGIPYDKAARRDELLRHMWTSFREGKFHSIPASIRAMHDSMRAQAHDPCAAYKVDKARLLEWEEARFASKPTLAEQFTFDQKRFLERYFLDADGKRDCTSTPTPLILEGIPHGPDRVLRQLLHKGKVLGLKVKSYYWHFEKYGPDGKEYKSGTIILSWSIRDVVESHAFPKKVRLRVDEQSKTNHLRWQRARYEEQLRYCARPLKANNPSLQGRYLLRRPRMDDSKTMPYGLYLNIKKPRKDSGLPRGVFEAELECTMESRSLEGTLLLCDDLEILMSYFGVQRKPEVPTARVRRRRVRNWEKTVSASGKDGEDSRLWEVQQKRRTVPLLYHVSWKQVRSDRNVEIHEQHNDEEWKYGRIMFKDETFAQFGAEMDVAHIFPMSFWGGGKVADVGEAPGLPIRVGRGVESSDEEESPRLECESEPM